MSLRVAFMGTPAFAVPVFEALAGSRHHVIVAYTRPPSASGRGLRERPSPVAEAAARAGITVETPARFRDADTLAGFATLAPDVAVVVAYGQLLPQAALDVPRLGCLNLHASLLPRWRGAAPIHRAVMAGDRETGLAAMRMEAGLDTGPVALTERVSIGPDDTTGDVHDRLAALGGALVLRALDALEAGTLAFTPQSAAGVTYAAKIGNDEARIRWDAPAREVHNHVRGLSPAPGAFFEAELADGLARVKVRSTAVADGSGPPGTLLDADGTVACGDGAVRLLVVQRAGRAALPAAAFIRGARLEPGARLG